MNATFLNYWFLLLLLKVGAYFKDLYTAHSFPESKLFTRSVKSGVNN